MSKWTQLKSSLTLGVEWSQLHSVAPAGSRLHPCHPEILNSFGNEGFMFSSCKLQSQSYPDLTSSRAGPLKSCHQSLVEGWSRIVFQFIIKVFSVGLKS